MGAFYEKTPYYGTIVISNVQTWYERGKIKLNIGKMILNTLNKFLSKRVLGLIRNDNKKDLDKAREFEKIRKLFDMSPETDYTLDNQTWDDLDMNKVYEKLDRTYSSSGEAALYSMLRNPLMDEEKVKERGNLIKLFNEDSKLRESLQCIFFNLNNDFKNGFLDMIENDLKINKAKYYIYTFMGKIIPLIIILLAIFINMKFMIALFVLSYINIEINKREVRTIKTNGIFYLRKNIVAAKKIVSIDNKDINYYKKK